MKQREILTLLGKVYVVTNMTFTCDTMYLPNFF